MNKSIQSLAELSEIDAKIARLNNERLAIQKQEELKTKSLLEAKNALLTTEKAVALKEAHCKQTEKNLKSEREHLVDRRRALQSLGTIKAQSAAEREIDGMAKKLDMHEEELILALEVLSKEQAIAQKLHDDYTTLQNEMMSFNDNLQQTLPQLSEREAIYLAERTQLLTQINPLLLKAYTAILVRYPGDALAHFDTTKSCCKGCFQKISPQIMVKILSGSDEVVKCSGCGRLLYAET